MGWITVIVYSILPVLLGLRCVQEIARIARFTVYAGGYLLQ